MDLILDSRSPITFPVANISVVVVVNEGTNTGLISITLSPPTVSRGGSRVWGRGGQAPTPSKLSLLKNYDEQGVPIGKYVYRTTAY